MQIWQYFNILKRKKHKNSKIKFNNFSSKISEFAFRKIYVQIFEKCYLTTASKNFQIKLK